MSAELRMQSLPPLNAETQLFSLADVVFARCGLYPTDYKEPKAGKQFYAVPNGSAGYLKYYVNESEKLVLDKALNQLTELEWQNRGAFDYDNPNSECHNHWIFMHNYSALSSESREVLKVAIEGAKLGVDYSAVLESLKTKYLISNCLISDVHMIERMRDKLGRDLTGKEVHGYIQEEENFLDKREIRRKGEYSRESIAIYLAANNIHSQFDFGQKAILANSSVIDSEEIMKSVLIPATQEHQMLLAFLQFGGLVIRKLPNKLPNSSIWGFKRINKFAIKEERDPETIRKAMQRALDHFDGMHKQGEPLPDEIKNIDAIWRGLVK
jgi:hypothetical protein